MMRIVCSEHLLVSLHWQWLRVLWLCLWWCRMLLIVSGGWRSALGSLLCRRRHLACRAASLGARSRAPIVPSASGTAAHWLSAAAAAFDNNSVRMSAISWIVSQLDASMTHTVIQHILFVVVDEHFEERLLLVAQLEQAFAVAAIGRVVFAYGHVQLVQLVVHGVYLVAEEANVVQIRLVQSEQAHATRRRAQWANALVVIVIVIVIVVEHKVGQLDHGHDWWWRWGWRRRSLNDGDSFARSPIQNVVAFGARLAEQLRIFSSFAHIHRSYHLAAASAAAADVARRHDSCLRCI